MKLLLAVDSVTTLDILLDEMMTRSWPSGTKARVLSIRTEIVDPKDIPADVVTMRSRVRLI